MKWRLDKFLTASQLTRKRGFGQNDLLQITFQIYSLVKQNVVFHPRRNARMLFETNSRDALFSEEDTNMQVATLWSQF